MSEREPPAAWACRFPPPCAAAAPPPRCPPPPAENPPPAAAPPRENPPPPPRLPPLCASTSLTSPAMRTLMPSAVPTKDHDFAFIIWLLYRQQPCDQPIGAASQPRTPLSGRRRAASLRTSHR